MAKTKDIDEVLTPQEDISTETEKDEPEKVTETKTEAKSAPKSESKDHSCARSSDVTELQKEVTQLKAVVLFVANQIGSPELIRTLRQSFPGLIKD